jgi:subtilisin family serine protease
MARNGRLIRAGAALIAIGCAAGARAGTLEPELEEALGRLPPDAEVAVIARLDARVDPARFLAVADRSVRRARLIRALRATAAAAQAPLLALLSQRNARRVRSIWLDDRIAFAARPAVIRELAAKAGVSSVGLDATFTLAAPAATSSAPAEWNLEAIRAPELWALGAAGDGAVVATLDSGVDPWHPDVGPRWRGGYNSWFDPNGQHATPYDRSGHGTQVMGLLVGGDAGGTAIGVAPLARWIAVKIFDDSGAATLSGVHLGLQWLLDPDGNPDTDDAPDVVNGSWWLSGTVDECGSEFSGDLGALRAADIAVVFAAGNAGSAPATSVSPGNDPSSLAVGATNEWSGVAALSSRGPSACGGGIYPGVVAPGTNVRTTDLTLGAFPLSYVSVTGTSFAAPHVSGALALLRSAFPTATVAELEAALSATAVDLGAPGPDHDSGAGLIDVRAAYDRLLAVVQHPMAAPDAFVTAEGTTLAVPSPGVLGNDLDPQGDRLTAVLSRGASAGDLDLRADGSFVYVPWPGFAGTDDFTYTASDGVHQSGATTVTLTVEPVAPPSHPPVAKDDVAGVAEDGAVVIDVLANDTDADGEVLTIRSVSPALRGAVSSDGARVVYTPSRDFAGVDSFTYVATDGANESAAATVTVTVNAVNDAPVAVNDAASTARNVAVRIGVLANDRDVDGTIVAASVTIVTGPRKGKAAPAGDGSVTYTPNRNFKGADSFTYAVRDAAGAKSNVATVTVTVK